MARRGAGFFRSWLAGRRLFTWLTFARLAVLVFVTVFLLESMFMLGGYDSVLQRPLTTYFDLLTTVSGLHPIDRLIDDARQQQNALLAQRSLDLGSAAEMYRKRRGRHPPPGFEHWVAYALKTNAVLVEDFFDRIYHDLNPFWAIDPKKIREQANAGEFVVRVRDGKAFGEGDTEDRVPWLQLWTDLVGEAAKHLPDVDMPINYMDESRLLVPWDTINGYMTKALEEKVMTPIEDVVGTFNKNLTKLDRTRGNYTFEPEWIHDAAAYWDHTRECCSPRSPSREVPRIEDFSEVPQIPFEANTAFTYRGYISNYSAAIDPCQQPEIRQLHGTFIEPISMASTKELFPLFGGSKLPVNNEILIPGAMYITDEARYSGGRSHGPPWDLKSNGVVWRGVASGGRNKEENWHHFQRHRLVEMLNGTTVARMEATNSRAHTFEMAPLAKYNFNRRKEGRIGAWLKNHSNAGFIDRMCHPKESECDYVEPFMSRVEPIDMADQYRQKFIPDADGNSFSARYRGLLLSTSLPLKATLYTEWHDDRLMPWLHFAPMDNTFMDMYAILDYFTRDEKGDKAAQLIAEQGMEWGAKVLRRDDMLLYVWRLLLEFARVCDEDRHHLAFIGDLLPDTE